MPTTDQNATAYRGGGLNIEITVTDAAGDPLDLSTMDLFYSIATSAGVAASLQKTEADGIAVAANVVTVSLDADDTKSLPARTYYHELFGDDAGVVSVLMTGQLTVAEAQAARHSQ